MELVADADDRAVGERLKGLEFEGGAIAQAAEIAPGGVEATGHRHQLAWEGLEIADVHREMGVAPFTAGEGFNLQVGEVVQLAAVTERGVQDPCAGGCCRRCAAWSRGADGGGRTRHEATLYARVNSRRAMGSSGLTPSSSICWKQVLQAQAGSP